MCARVKMKYNTSALQVCLWHDKHLELMTLPTSSLFQMGQKLAGSTALADGLLLDDSRVHHVLQICSFFVLPPPSALNHLAVYV